MPDRMPNRMSQDMSDRMPEDVPVRTCINVMVGITRSKVILLVTFPTVKGQEYSMAAFVVRRRIRTGHPDIWSNQTLLSY